MSKPDSTQEVYNYVRDKIIARELFPGSRIIEEELADALHTNRTSVRSGIMKLCYDGLVTAERHKGAFVAKPNMVDMNHVYAVRKLLESEAARLASSTITDAGLHRMEQSLKKQILLEENYSMAEFVKLNHAFHWEIVQAAGNEYLKKFLHELFNKTAIYLMFYDCSGSGKLSISAHTTILSALKKRDAAAAIAAIGADIACAMECIEIT